ncbi:MAG: 50S ribosomal protein L4 [Verrucomicrobia bacterium]|nr:MAG: 50S ribosomal protein L4 [Verrucomicrobiota bacterium]
MKFKLYNPDGSFAREVEYEGIPTFEGDKGLQAVKEVVVAQAANARQGNASTKTRGEVSGGGKKPWRQKGTGRARHGSTRSPIWTGGGVVFGPKPRDYSKKINAKVKALAFRRAFYDRAIAGEIDIIEKLEVEPAKTKVLNGIVSKIAKSGKVLLVDEKFAETSRRAARNIERISTTEAALLNTTELCRYDRILLTNSAMDTVLNRLKGA